MICNDLKILNSQNLTDVFDADSADGQEPTSLPYFHFNYPETGKRNTFPPKNFEYKNFLKFDQNNIHQTLAKDQIEESGLKFFFQILTPMRRVVSVKTIGCFTAL